MLTELFSCCLSFLGSAGDDATRDSGAGLGY